MMLQVLQITKSPLIVLQCKSSHQNYNVLPFIWNKFHLGSCHSLTVYNCACQNASNPSDTNCIQTVLLTNLVTVISLLLVLTHLEPPSDLYSLSRLTYTWVAAHTLVYSEGTLNPRVSLQSSYLTTWVSILSKHHNQLQNMQTQGTPEWSLIYEDTLNPRVVSTRSPLN